MLLRVLHHAVVVQDVHQEERLAVPAHDVAENRR
jgi:hypothetical protein